VARTRNHRPGERIADAVARAADASAAPWGIAAVPGTDRARLTVEDWLPAATAAVAARMIDRLGVPAAIVPRSIVTATGAPVLIAVDDEALIETAARRSLAFWVERWRHAGDRAALAALAPPPGQSTEPLGSVILAGVGDAHRPGDSTAPPPPPHPCQFVRHNPAALTLACDVTADGYAVVLDAWAPGWTATVDGRAVPVERADLIARGVRVTPGSRRIDLEYSPPGWRLGALLSALTAIGLALVAWWARSVRK
jgi:hypothetical protein